MARTLTEQLGHDIREEADKYKEQLIYGACDDWAKYRELRGILYGLGLAEEIINEREKQIRERHGDE